MKTFSLNTEEDMARFGATLAPRLAAGDCLLLSGPVGAGKSVLARAIVQTRLAALGRAEDVPSPTFTLVQTYDLDKVQIWHSDLYRLSSLEELFELGLEEAFSDQITLVEWAERLGPLAPAGALSVSIAPAADDSRRLSLEWSEPKWDSKLHGLGQHRAEA